MPLPGGPSAKFGTRYEGKWTVDCMLDVMSEQAKSIRLEPPGDEGQGIEFWIEKGARREYHQVKRQRASQGRWRLKDLEAEGILAAFWSGLASDPEACCVFVSSHAASPLDDLSERARGAQSTEEFEGQFLSKELKAEFQRLCHIWSCRQAEAFDALRRTYVRTIDEETLAKNVRARAAGLVEGDPENAMDVLAEFALGEVHAELRTQDIWKHLEERSFRRRDWSAEASVLAAVQQATERYLRPIKRSAIGGEEIPRSETEAVVKALGTSGRPSHVLLTGEAGVGKSGVVAQVIGKCQQSGWPVLALRVDHLQPTLLPEEVGAQIGIPGSPATVLAAIAQGRDSLLVIDQIDAVSMASGRFPEFFDCIEEVLNESEVHRIHVLLACRKFDLENDSRLRRLVEKEGYARELVVERLSADEVAVATDRLGFEEGVLSPGQVEVLSVPLHLSLLAEIGSQESSALSFRSGKDLFDLYWDRKQELIRERLAESVQWSDVIDVMCEFMSEHKVLSVPVPTVDAFREDARAMESEAVLVEDRTRYSFFHQSFFDYAFARRFVGTGKGLVPFLVGDDQDLFRRAQVRQILVYKRESDRPSYVDDVRAILDRPGIRFHIKQIVFALLRDMDSPTQAEWKLLKKRITDGDPALRRQAWGALDSSLPWFRLVDSSGEVAGWLAGNEDGVIDEALSFLLRVHRCGSEAECDRIAELLEPYVGSSETWDRRLGAFMQWSDLTFSRRYFELFLKMIDLGLMDEVRGLAVNSDFWSLIYVLSSAKPEWAAEAIGRHLMRWLKISRDRGERNPFDLIGPSSSHSDAHVLVESAHGAPAAFIEFVLPFMLEVMDATADRGDKEPFRDGVWAYRHRAEALFGSGALLAAIEAALRDLAEADPEACQSACARLAGSQFETAHFLVARAYAANGQHFADAAAEYLCDKQERLSLGYMDGPHWATRELLEAITPHCSEDLLACLESTVLSYYTDWEKGEGRKSMGYSQFVLLEGMDRPRLSEVALRRLEEWRRKFDKPREPVEVVVTTVTSPIRQEAVEKMNDAQWLRAIGRYGETRGRLDLGDPEGGAHELSQLLEKEAKADPERFASLVEQFPDDTHPYYFDAILRAFRETTVDVPSVMRVCTRCHELPGRPCGRWITGPIARVADQELPDEALEIVRWYATDDPDPEEDGWREETGDDRSPDERIMSEGINSVRGSAALDMRALLFHDGERLEKLLPALEKMAEDRSVAVRAYVASTLTATLRHDRDTAVRLFIRLCEADEALLKTPFVDEFLFYAVRTHFESLAPIIERMQGSDDPDVAAAGARQACVAALTVEGAEALGEGCLKGGTALRRGAASVFAANASTSDAGSLCERGLLELFSDDEEQVRSEAATCFRSFEGDQLGAHGELIEGFIASPAFSDRYFDLLQALTRTTATLPDATCHACDRFLDLSGSEAGDIRTHAAADADTVCKLLVRVYSQTRDDEVRKKCLDVFDRMTALEVYGLDKLFALYER